MSCIITAVRWIPRGKVTGPPRNAAALTKEEFEKIKQRLAGDLSADTKGVIGSDDDAEMQDTTNADRSESKQTEPSTATPRSGSDPFDLENYDEDEMANVNASASFSGQQFFHVLEKDLKLAVAAGGDFDDSKSDEDALTIRQTDHLLLSVNAKSDVSTIDICVYDDDNGAFYIHHDITLGDMPCCAEWIEFSPKSPTGNDHLCAVGFMNSVIELWEVNVTDVLDPVATFGANQTDLLLNEGKVGKKKAKGHAKEKPQRQGHSNAVMDIHVNPIKGHLMASGSADKSCLTWDVTTGTVIHSYSHHTAEIQNVRWHPSDPNVLLTASYDGTFSVVDVRQSGHQVIVPFPGSNRLPVTATWNPHDATMGLISMSTGHVSAFDVRRTSTNISAAPLLSSTEQACKTALLWDISAHKTDCSIAISPLVSNLMMTASEDGSAKVWSLQPRGAAFSEGKTEAHLPNLEFEKSLKGGPLFGVQAHPGVPNLFAFSGNDIVLWDITDTPSLVTRFGLEKYA